MERKKDNRGETIPVQGEQQERAPSAPHERDESAQSQESSEPTGKAIGELGRRDVERGVQDTTKQAEMDRAYDRQK